MNLSTKIFAGLVTLSLFISGLTMYSVTTLKSDLTEAFQALCGDPATTQGQTSQQAAAPAQAGQAASATPDDKNVFRRAVLKYRQMNCITPAGTPGQAPGVGANSPQNPGTPPVTGTVAGGVITWSTVEEGNRILDSANAIQASGYVRANQPLTPPQLAAPSGM